MREQKLNRIVKADNQINITTSGMVINLSEQHSLVSNWIAELRDVEIQKDRMRFRRNLERLGAIAAAATSKGLRFDETEIQTPLGIAAC